MTRGRKPKDPTELTAEKKTAEKKPVEKKAVEKKPAEKKTVVKAKNNTVVDTSKKVVYIFFNCNEEKSHDSMNIFYNHFAYKNTIASRKALWNKLQQEEEEGRIQFLDKDAASKAILSGDPQDASEFLKFGAVEAIPCE